MTTVVKRIEMKLEEFIKNPSKYQIIKNRKTKLIIIKDGFFKFKLGFTKKEPLCQCNTIKKVEYCDHILYYFSKELLLTTHIIAYLDIENVYNKLLQLLASEENVDFNKELCTEINSYFEQNECRICLDKLNSSKYKFELFKCHKCKNYVHDKCMTQWKTFKKSNDCLKRQCIYCSN